MISQRFALYNFPRICQLLACLNVGRLYAVLFGYATNRISGTDLTPSLLIAASVRAAPGIEQ
jgi:hypothetical protein